MQPTELVTVFAENVKRFRKSLGMTQGQLAERLDVHVPYISDLERGVKSPYLPNLAKLAEALEVEPFELLAVHSKIPA